MKNISQEKLRMLVVPQPPLDEQASIAATFDAVEQRIRAEHGHLRAARILKSALMAVLLTGEVRVKPDPEPA